MPHPRYTTTYPTVVTATVLAAKDPSEIKHELPCLELRSLHGSCGEGRISNLKAPAPVSQSNARCCLCQLGKESRAGLLEFSFNAGET